MRLLSRTDGVLKLTPDCPPEESYAILSHTWGPSEEEVTLEDIQNRAYGGKAGYRKIEFCLEQAERDGYRYVWVDTCCIDKRDRNELGEAINQMFKWYERADVCYVYLADIVRRPIGQSRWFSRGWTLQELVAPHDVRFYSSDRQFLGDKFKLREEILVAAGIDTLSNLADVSIHDRYRWSLGRKTKRPEDESYCLLGILGVSLLFNYGEGRRRARERLLEEVDKEYGRQCGRSMQSIEADHEPGPTPERLLRSLEFNGMGARRRKIKDPFPETCKWVLVHQSYQTWSAAQTEKRFLWIKGNPGSGKSTLMRFLEQEVKQGPGEIKVAFYFNAGSSVLERTALGMYRSLLRQLLENNVQALRMLIQYMADQDLVLQSWTLQTLQTALKFCIRCLCVRVRCFVDALDECNNSEAQDIVDFFEDLSQTEPQLFICFASRYYPTISARKAVELLLERERSHTQDLRDYVNGRLGVGQDAWDCDLKLRIVQKARGIFLWAVLVVNLLNQELSAGSMYNVEKRLDELPSQLNELLQEIVSRDTAELDRFRFSLHWVLFAARPLTPEEYYFAVVTSFAAAGLVHESAYTRLRDHSSITPDRITRFVLSSSRGLAEVVIDRLSPSRGTVQFIHQSVRDFLLDHNGLNNLHTHVDGDVTSWAQENMGRVCQRYTATDFMVRTNQESQWISWRSLPESKWRHILPTHDSYPFLSYAFKYQLYHADQAATSREQDCFLKRFDVDLFRNVYSIFPSRVAAESHPFNLPRYDLMHTLVRFGTLNLISTAQRLGFDVNSPQRCFSPLLAAIRYRNPPVARLLLSYGADPERVDETGATALVVAIHQGNLDICQILLEHGADHGAFDRDGNTPLLVAIRIGNVDICQALLKHGADAAKKSSQGVSPLSSAVMQSRKECVRLLVEHGARAEASTNEGESTLVAALHAPDILEILLNVQDADAEAAEKFAMRTLVKMQEFMNHNADLRSRRLCRSPCWVCETPRSFLRHRQSMAEFCECRVSMSIYGTTFPCTITLLHLLRRTAGLCPDSPLDDTLSSLQEARREGAGLTLTHPPTLKDASTSTFHAGIAATEACHYINYLRHSRLAQIDLRN